MKKPKALIFLAAIALFTPLTLSGQSLQELPKTENAQEPDNAPQDLPTAEKVLEDYILVKGGADNHREIQTIVSHGRMTFPSSKTTGELVIYQSAPNKMRMEMTFEQSGKTTTVFDGENAWVEEVSFDEDGNPEEPRFSLMSDERLARSKMQANINLYLDLFQIFEKVECVGEVEFNDRACYVIQATDDEAPSITAFFDKETKFLIGSRFEMNDGQGNPVEVTSKITRYRDVGNVKMSHKVVASLSVLTQVVVMESIELNQDIPEDKFGVPPAVTKLIKEK